MWPGPRHGRSVATPRIGQSGRVSHWLAGRCWPCDPQWTLSRSERDLPQREPALQLGLDRQLVLELGLELELALVVARLRAGRGHERVALAALEVVDEEDGLAARVRVLEGE